MIKVPNSLFTPKKHNGRLGKVFIYAFDVNNIGVSPEQCPDWEQYSLYRKTWRARLSGGNWAFDLPAQIIKFYLLRDVRTKMVTSISGGNILITVTRK